MYTDIYILGDTKRQIHLKTATFIQDTKKFLLCDNEQLGTYYKHGHSLHSKKKKKATLPNTIYFCRLLERKQEEK